MRERTTETALTPATPRTRTSRLVLCLTAVFAVLYLPWLAVEPPVIGLESTRIMVARDMVRSGDWIVPTQNGATYLAKPPLGYWMIAIGTAPLGGVGILSARAVSALFLLAIALVTALFARREAGERTGLLAGLCVLGAALCLEKGMRAEVETSFALFTTLAVLGGFRAVWSERRALAWTAGAGLALGAATLIKGPLAMLVFLLAMGGLAAATPARHALALRRSALALLVGAAVGGAWLLALAGRGAGQGEYGKLIQETFQRIHAPGPTNREPWWFYAPALLVAFLPASLLLPALWTRRSPARPGDERQQALFGMLVGWTLLSLVALSLSAGKETRYLMATIPGWAVLAAWAWHRPDPQPWLASWRRLLARTGLGLAWMLPVGLVIGAWMLRTSAASGIALAAVLALAGLAFLLRGRRTAHAGMLWAAMLLELFAVRAFWAAGPMAERNAKFPIARMGAEIAAHLEPGQPFVQVGEYNSCVQLLVDRPIRLAHSSADVGAALVQEPHTRYVLARTRYLPPGEEGELVEVASWPFGSAEYRLLRAP